MCATFNFFDITQQQPLKRFVYKTNGLILTLIRLQSTCNPFSPIKFPKVERQFSLRDFISSLHNKFRVDAGQSRNLWVDPNVISPLERMMIKIIRLTDCKLQTTRKICAVDCSPRIITQNWMGDINWSNGICNWSSIINANGF